MREYDPEKLMVEYDGEFVPRKMCSMGADGIADDVDICADICAEVESNGCDGCAIQECFNRLGEYEATNLTPEKILEVDKMYQELSKEVMQYRKIGSVQECQEARERQVMNKPNIWGDGYDDEGNMIYDMYDCPNCGKSYEIDYEKYKFCPECGQAIDWDRKEREDYDRE